MAKLKIEKWSEDVYPGMGNLLSHYENLTSRELVIVLGATLDLALAELIELKLVDDAETAQSFLGLGGGEGVADSFSARIKLAYLLGILHKPQYGIFNEIRKIRNSFAHVVNVDLLSSDIQSHIQRLLDRHFNFQNELFKEGRIPHDPSWLNPELRPLLSTDENACRILLTGILCVQQAFFEKLKHNINHLERIRFSN